jgi:RNA polymerase sigma-70 factor (ECF subfamily)
MDIETAIASVKAGKTDALAVVVREYEWRLRAFIASYCPARDQVDDIAQDTFIWAFEHLDQYQPNTRFYTWLKAIARNKLLADLEQQRREARNRNRYLEYLQATAHHAELSSSNESIADLTDALQNCVEKLPDHSRSLLLRRYENRDTVRDISQDLGRKEGSVKSMLFRIRQALRRCIEGRQVAEGAPVGVSS